MNTIHNKNVHFGDLNLYRVMLAIAEEGTTIAAAKRLHLSQSAISHALKRLRQMLNDPVFVKHGRNLVLTPYARSVLPTVRQAISQLVDCSNKLIVFNSSESELEFSLGFRDILEFLIIPNLIKPLREQKSSIKIRSRRLVLQDIEDKLLNGKLDVVIDLETPTGSRIASEELAREHLCVLVGKNHPSFEQRKISLQTYSSSEHVLVSLNKQEKAFVDNRMGVHGIQRSIALYCEHYLPAARTAELTDLILTMPYSYALYLAKFLKVRILQLPFPCEPLSVRMYWRNETSNEAYMQWILERLRAVTTEALSPYELK